MHSRYLRPTGQDVCHDDEPTLAHPCRPEPTAYIRVTLVVHVLWVWANV